MFTQNFSEELSHKRVSLARDLYLSMSTETHKNSKDMYSSLFFHFREKKMLFKSLKSSN